MAPTPEVYSTIGNLRETVGAASTQASVIIGENAQLIEGSRRAVDSSRKLMADMDRLVNESADRR